MSLKYILIRDSFSEFLVDIFKSESPICQTKSVDFLVYAGLFYHGIQKGGNVIRGLCHIFGISGKSMTSRKVSK